MTVPGMDLSSWQAVTPSLAGLGFVVPRATYGTRPDAKFRQHAAAGRAAGLVVPAYHFGTGVTTPEVQFAAFMAVAAGADANVLDLESESGKTPMSHAQARTWIALSKRTGKKTLLYHSEFGFPDLGQDGNWPAHWGVVRPTMANWVLHQYRGSPLDLDRFNGNLAQLRAYFGKLPPKPTTYHLAFTGGAFWVYELNKAGHITGRHSKRFSAPTGAPCGPLRHRPWDGHGSRWVTQVKAGLLKGSWVGVPQPHIRYEVVR